MKKLLLSVALGMAALTVAPAPSQAGTFGLFTGCGSCCSSSCNFCVRPYNAFTPVCSGNITCMGCMPFTYPSPNYSGLNYAGPDYSGYDTGAPCCGTPTVIGESVNQNQTLPPLPQYAAPNPLPNPMQQPTIIPGASKLPNPYGAVQAGYSPAYAPAYNPYVYYNYYTPRMQTPYYWNAK